MRKRERRNEILRMKIRTKQREKKTVWKRKKKRSVNKLNQFFHQHLMFLNFSIAYLFILVLFKARNVFLILKTLFLFEILKIFLWINIFQKQHVNIFFKKNKR
jgi:hypothetical protein